MSSLVYERFPNCLVMFLNCGLIALMVVFQVRSLQPGGCDTKLNNHFREGILGQVGMFPWLGVIRVQLYEGTRIRIALTGAVLIKHGYALTVADDMAKIPNEIFRRDSQAMFYPYDGEPWLFKLVERLVHPEYPNIMNSIALIKLELENNGPAKLRPICWPTLHYNASDQLYVLGITDANDVLEKEAYKVQYVRQYDCMVFYNKADLNNMDDLARDYQCAYARNSNRTCIWETGMVLASNATGTWVLLGFGIRGPGCAAPGRFIEMYQYLHWIDKSTTNLDDGENFNRELNSRRSGHKKKSKIVDIPIHHFFRSDDDVISNISQTTAWIFDWYELGIGEYGLDRIDKNAIILTNFKYQADNASDCLKMSKLVYSEVTKIHADNYLPGRINSATYSISLHDLSVKNFTCVIIRVHAYNKTKPHLWFSWGTYAEPLERYETPSYLLKKYPIPKREKNETKTDDGDTNPNSKYFRKSGSKVKTTNLIPESIINKITIVLDDLIDVLGNGTINDNFGEPIFPKVVEIVEELNKITDEQLPGYGPELKPTIDEIGLCGDQLETSAAYKQHRIYFCLNKLGIIRNHLRLMKMELTTTTSTAKPVVNTTWTPHKNLEAAYITENPSRLAFPPFLNLLLEFEFYQKAELELEVWSHLVPDTGAGATRAPASRTRLRHNITLATLKDPNDKRRLRQPAKMRRADNDDVEFYRRDITDEFEFHRRDFTGDVGFYGTSSVRNLRNACELVELGSVYVISVVFCTLWL